MNDTVIRVEQLSKRYRIGKAQQRHDTLRDVLAAGLRAPLQRLGHRGRYRGKDTDHGTLWALKDVSFEVQRGQVVGIIGRNGAGKSTLLKILSRITEPTEGWAAIDGRVGSLLEVGTGFHPELTGRENIYLNGAILGMRRAEIARKFDEIVAFAEVERFLDMPVKHYSSGMYLRLAFSVAAHLEPEILLVDEVLAVGDADFQKKCLGKMQSVAREERTVLFVSHNLGVVQALCQRCILLEDGRVCSDAPAAEAVSVYLQSLEQDSSQDLLDRKGRTGKGQVRLARVVVSTADGSSAALATGYPARFAFHVTEMLPGLVCTFTIYDHLGQAVAHFNSSIHSPMDSHAHAQGTQMICEFDELLLVPGQYRINVGLASGGELQDHIEAAALFDVESGFVEGRPVSSGSGYGSVSLAHRWILAG